MKKYLVQIIVLLLGGLGGYYVASQLNILSDVVTNYNLRDNNDITENEYIKNTQTNDLILVDGYYDDFVIDLRYASKNNITKTKLYEHRNMYLQKETMDKLIMVNEELKLKGYKIKIWDAYRPMGVQKKLWATYPNANFIANPFTTGSNHNRGTSVDVTLVTVGGDDVKMPTGFDEFGGKCRRGSVWTKEEQKNVELLTTTMEKHGFNIIESEWWHFDDENSSQYPIMDYNFSELLRK